MKTNNNIDLTIKNYLRDRNEEKENKHKSSGKLSAGKLGWPLQWQILHHLGVKQKPFEDYTLRVFERGKNVEERIEEILTDRNLVISSQELVRYRDCIGYCDLVVDAARMGLDEVELPLELKSTKNSKFARIRRQKEADYSHKLQAGLYGLALGKRYFGVTYVAADDYRTLTYIYEADEVKTEIDRIIKIYKMALHLKTIPTFEANPHCGWQSSPKYNNYYSWMFKTKEELKEISRELF